MTVYRNIPPSVDQQHVSSNECLGDSQLAIVSLSEGIWRDVIEKKDATLTRHFLESRTLTKNEQSMNKALFDSQICQCWDALKESFTSIISQFLAALR